jgi:hypothetical protein
LVFQDKQLMQLKKKNLILVCQLPLKWQIYLKQQLKTYLHFLINMKESKTSTGAGIGLIAGVIIGSITNNVGLWIALGLCFGAGIGQILDK